jgi:3-hydroxyisobutyrate dehydrogenase-like beta-hydroxyacid dehydrogenase
MMLSTNTVISILPNDVAVTSVANALLSEAKGSITHISCSTVSPTTSRKLAELYAENNSTFIAAPVFARPDGLARKQATWMIAGEKNGRDIASSLLASSGKVY